MKFLRGSMLRFTNPNPREGHKILLECAEAGVVDAFHIVAMDYQNGSRTTKDPVAAVHWHRALSDAGNPLGHYHLGNCYHHGLGVKQDDVEAFRLMTLAAEYKNAPPSSPEGVGVLEAKNGLGYLHWTGRGVPQDFKKAFDFFTIASDAGHLDALYFLSGLHFQGEGVPQNFTLAAVLSGQAAERGHVGAKCYLGLQHLHGLGMPKNIRMAVKLFREAVAKGDQKGMANNELGQLYEAGLGVEQSWEKALQFFETAAALGDGRAAQRLAMLHQEGMGGVEKNVAKAKRYLQLARDQNTTLADWSTTRAEAEENLSMIRHVCETCSAVRDDLKVCARCKGPRYCGPICQKADWAQHKSVCERVARMAATQNG